MDEKLYRRFVLRALVAILTCLQFLIKSMMQGIITEFIVDSTKDLANEIAKYLHDTEGK